MPLQTSGPISLGDIQTEFGGSNPISLNEYYAGGGLVPSGTTGINGAIPTSGQISISQFYGAPEVTVQLPLSIFVFDQRSGFTAEAGVILTSGGDVQEFTSTSGAIDVGDWITPKSAAGNAYEARVSNITGSTPTGSATNTWLGLGTTRTWVISQSTFGINNSTFDLEIRRASDQVVLASTTVDLTAERF